MGVPLFTRRRALQIAAAGLAAVVPGPHASAARLRQATPTASGSVTPEAVSTAVAELDGVLEGFMARTGVPGVAVAIVHRDQIVHTAGYGLRETGTTDAVDDDTVFQLASVSKCLAATTVAAVVGDGVVTWDARMRDLDPSFALYDAWVTSEVTLRDLFSHRSGMRDHGGDDLEDLGYDRAEILHRLRYLRPEGPFRAHYAYTNFGLTAAAVAAAGAAGMEWEELAAARLYGPLGMGRTSSRFDDFIGEPNRALGHVLVDGAYVAKYQRQPDAQSPAGGVSSSARDLGRWLRLVLGAGNIDGETIVAAAALEETFRPHIANNSAANPAFDRTGFYGLGWNVGYDDQGRVVIGHSGAFGLGAGTTVSIMPAESLGIVVLSNAAANGLVEAVARSFMDLALTGDIAHDYLEIFAPLIAASLAPGYGRMVDYGDAPDDPTPSLPLDAYAGTFTNDFYGDITIEVENGGLVLQIGPKRTAFPMRHYDRDIFLYQPVGENAAGESAVSFAIGIDGAARGVTIEILDITTQGTFTRREPAE